MNTKRITLLVLAGTALLFPIEAGAVQVGSPNIPWSSHSYHQEAPAPVEIVREEKPVILHTPPLEISSNENFQISAIVKDIGAGTPVIHYRFGDSGKYYTRLMHQREPQIYGIDILSAALIDKQIEYYLEVTTGSKSLANLGTAETPMSVKIHTPGFPAWMIITGIFVLAGTLLIRPVIRWTGNKPREKDEEEFFRASSFKASTKKVTRLR